MSFEPLALSPRDAATMLAVSRRTVSRLIRTHKLVVVSTASARWSMSSPSRRSMRACR